MNLRFASVLCVALTAAIAAALAPRAAADELWRQNPYDTVGGYSSQDARNDGGLGWFSEVADNFSAPVPWTINSVEFWGGYVTVVPGNTHGFTIRFYSDNNSSPGTLISAQDVFTFSEVVYYTFPAPQLFNGYHYTVTLPQAVQVPAGTSWMSVVAILDRGGSADEPQWGWAQSTDTNAPFAQQWFFSATHTFAPLQGDAAFVLNGSAGGATGVCCRGATCTTSLTSAAACSATIPSGTLAGASFAAAATCNATGNAVSPCCYADYNKSGGISVQDIFDFLGDWFASSPLARTGSDGTPAPLAVQNIFDFLNGWFSGC